ncbi:hypothetical protein, partial [Nocardioides sp.]|uniref:hypothetical protein n=1 Tax=Nocardioides sp. TaxID=35761 RepID=UPI0019809D4A
GGGEACLRGRDVGGGGWSETGRHVPAIVPQRAAGWSGGPDDPAPRRTPQWTAWAFVVVPRQPSGW